MHNIKTGLNFKANFSICYFLAFCFVRYKIRSRMCMNLVYVYVLVSDLITILCKTSKQVLLVYIK